MNGPRGTGICFDHAVDLKQSGGNAARTPLMRNAIDLPIDMPEAFGERGSCACCQLTYARKRQDIRIIVNAELGVLIASRGNNMDLAHTLAPLQLVDQPRHARISLARNFRQYERDIEPQMMLMLVPLKSAALRDDGYCHRRAKSRRLRS